MISTPCINVCKVHVNTQSCIGCKRTLEEIKVWSLLTDVERWYIMNSLKERSDARTTENTPNSGEQ